MRYFMGVDVGGTKIKAVVVDEKFRALAGVRAPSLPVSSIDELMERVFDAGQAVLNRAGVLSSELIGVGIGFFGLIDSESGRGITTLRLDFAGYDIAGAVSARFGVPAKVDNDAHVAVLGEMTYGAGLGHRDIVQLTIGTSTATGVVVDGSLLVGKSNVASEIGHLVIQTVGGRPCFCGRSGCVLNYVSGRAMLADMLEAMEADRQSVIWQLCGGDADAADLSMLDQALDLGDSAAVKVLEGTLTYLVPLASSLMMMFNPSILIVGGGVSNLGDRLIVPLSERATREVLHPTQACEIVQAHLGQESGLVGAIVMIAKHLGHPLPTTAPDQIGRSLHEAMEGATL